MSVAHREVLTAAVNAFASETEGLTIDADLWNRMRKAITALLDERGEATRSQPHRILDEREVRQVAKETGLPRYFYDTEEGRLDLARFAHNADQYLRGTSAQEGK